MTSAIGSSTLTPAQLAALLQQQSVQANTDTSATTSSTSAASVTTADPLTGTASILGSDVLNALVQNQTSQPTDSLTAPASGTGTSKAGYGGGDQSGSSSSSSSASVQAPYTVLNPDGSISTVTTNPDGTQTITVTTKAPASQSVQSSVLA